MAEKTAGEKIQILKKIERGQRTARRGLGGEGERGVFLVFWGYIAEKAISGLGGLATHPGYRCTVYRRVPPLTVYSVARLVRYGGCRYIFIIVITHWRKAACLLAPA